MFRRAQQYGLRSYLLVLAVACLLPVTAVSGWAVWKAGLAFKDTATSRLSDTARTLAGAVESEIDGRFATLGAILAARSHMGESGSLFRSNKDLEDLGLQGELSILEKRLNGTLVSHDNDPVVDGLAREAIEKNTRIISDIIFDKDGAPRIALALAGAELGGMRPAIVHEAHPTQLVRSLQQRPGQTLVDILVAVTDGKGHIIARSREPEKFLGKLVPDWSKLQALGTDHGLFDAITAEGSQIVFSFQKLRGTPGWVVVVGEPLETFSSRWKDPLKGLILGAGIAISLALATAAWISHLILRPVTGLGALSRAIVEDKPSDHRPAHFSFSSIREFDTLRKSFESAERALRERAEAERRIAQALAESEHRYRTVAEAGTLVFWRRAADGSVVSATGWEDLTGKPEAEALRSGWFDFVHPDDRVPVTIAWREAVARQSSIDVEFRVSDRDGRWRWVRARGAGIADGRGGIREWVGALEDVDARCQAQERVRHMAHHDTLTGLGNRLLLREKLEQAVTWAGRGEHGALLYIDLDRFKYVNDTFGHPVGDALLCAVTERLRSCTRDSDFIARLGGDEFSVVQCNAAQPQAASDLANRIVDVLSTPYDLDGQRLIIGASVGVAIIDASSLNADYYLRNADLALYRAKEDGRGRFCFFEPEMDSRMQERHRQEMDLRRGMSKGEFEVFYQPLVDLQSEMMTGFEALLRWIHPQRGLLGAEEFVALAEDTGLIVPLGQMVLTRACVEAAKWPENLTIAVNISTVQLTKHSLAEDVRAALHQSGLAPRRLALEITENALISNTDSAMSTLLKLKILGVKITLDDFGTGYSSLGYLRSFPFDKVKIHNSFIRDIGEQKEGAALVRAITGLCVSLGITAVAEGVETEEQRQFLGEEECNEGQGVLFGQPCSAADIPGLLSSSNEYVAGESQKRNHA